MPCFADALLVALDQGDKQSLLGAQMVVLLMAMDQQKAEQEAEIGMLQSFESLSATGAAGVGVPQAAATAASVQAQLAAFKAQAAPLLAQLTALRAEKQKVEAKLDAAISLTEERLEGSQLATYRADLQQVISACKCSLMLGRRHAALHTMTVPAVAPMSMPCIPKQGHAASLPVVVVRSIMTASEGDARARGVQRGVQCQL